MKKDGETINLLIPILIIGFLVAVGIIAYYTVQYSGFSLSNENKEIEEKKVTSLSLEESAEKQKECNLKLNINQRDWCYLNLAKTHFIETCNKIIQGNFKSYCNAIIYSDENYCKDIVNIPLKDSCYISIARSEQNKKICKYAERKDYCESLIGA